MKNENTNLTGKLLVAMPGMGDPRFEHSVVYICTHTAEGAMGLIVNKPQPQLKLWSLLEQLDISVKSLAHDIPVQFGGPVDETRGFVLHTNDYAVSPDTLPIGDHFAMTTTRTILQDLANGKGPEISLLVLGYSGWSAGQVEAELLQNGWLICDPNVEIVFGLANEHKWTAALRTIGIDPLMLSSQAGRA